MDSSKDSQPRGEHHIRIHDPRISVESSAASEVITSARSSVSLHALDFNLDQSKATNNGNPSPSNTADETAFLNIISVNGERLEYMDHDGQSAFRKNDKQRDGEPFLRRWFMTVVRGRAMPVTSLLVSTVWCAIAVGISFATSKNYKPHENGECRWWCTPLAVDGNALSYVGFALFLLTSFRVSE